MIFKLIHCGEDYIQVQEGKDKKNFFELDLHIARFFLPENKLIIDKKEVDVKELRKYLNE